MTEKEFKNLKIGDLVNLEFSEFKRQIVNQINITDGKLDTSPIDDPHLHYIVNYNEVTYVGWEKEEEEKKANNKKRVISMFFDNFRKDDCKNCPFKKECDNTYSLIRSSSTSAFGICEALTMDDKAYEVYNS